MWLKFLLITVLSIMGTFMHNQGHECYLTWLEIGTVVYSIGLIVTLVGCALITWKMKRSI